MKAAIALLSFGLLTSCGYHVAGTANTLPASIHTIAVPAFLNITTQYRIADLLGTSVARELISRTRYRVVAKPDDADAILSGAVVNFVSYPTIFDSTTNRATGVQALVTINVTLRDKAGNILYQRNNFEIRERYEISVYTSSYFDESEPALKRLADDASRSVVSAILEKF